MLIKFQKEDNFKTKFTVVGIYLFAFLILFEMLYKFTYSYNNSLALDAIPINAKSIGYFLITLTLTLLLLLKNNLVRQLILLLSYSILITITILFLLSLIQLEVFLFNHYIPLILYMVVPNIVVIYLFNNKTTLRIYKVTNHSKEQKLLLFISTIIAIGFLYVNNEKFL